MRRVKLGSKVWTAFMVSGKKKTASITTFHRKLTIFIPQKIQVYLLYSRIQNRKRSYHMWLLNIVKDFTKFFGDFLLKINSADGEARHFGVPAFDIWCTSSRINIFVWKSKIISNESLTPLQSVWNSQKKSYSTLRAKRVDKS